MGLGYSLSSSTATGYPASSVSLVSNPVRSFAGNMDLASTMSKSSVLTAPDSDDLFLTDILVGLTSTGYDCDANGHLELSDARTGITNAAIPVYMSYMHNANTDPTTILATSGIRIPANSAVHAQWTFSVQGFSSGNCDFRYTMSGYLAQGFLPFSHPFNACYWARVAQMAATPKNPKPPHSKTIQWLRAGPLNPHR